MLLKSADDIVLQQKLLNQRTTQVENLRRLDAIKWREQLTQLNTIKEQMKLGRTF
jgi:hypothetical protein